MRSFSARSSVGLSVKVGDTADHGGSGDHLVAVAGELFHQRHILGVALDASVAGVGVVALLDGPYFE